VNTRITLTGTTSRRSSHTITATTTTTTTTTTITTTTTTLSVPSSTSVGSTTTPLTTQTSTSTTLPATSIPTIRTTEEAVLDEIPLIVNANEPVGYGHKWYDFDRIRGTHVEVFATVLYPGHHIYTYFACSTIPGIFRVPPARVQEMYSNTYATSNTDQLVVKGVQEDFLSPKPQSNSTKLSGPKIITPSRHTARKRTPLRRKLASPTDSEVIDLDSANVDLDLDESSEGDGIGDDGDGSDDDALESDKYSNINL